MIPRHLMTIADVWVYDTSGAGILREICFEFTKCSYILFLNFLSSYRNVDYFEAWMSYTGNVMTFRLGSFWERALKSDHFLQFLYNWYQNKNLFLEKLIWYPTGLYSFLFLVYQFTKEVLNPGKYKISSWLRITLKANIHAFA